MKKLLVKFFITILSIPFITIFLIPSFVYAGEPAPFFASIAIYPYDKDGVEKTGIGIDTKIRSNNWQELSHYIPSNYFGSEITQIKIHLDLNNPDGFESTNFNYDDVYFGLEGGSVNLAPNPSFETGSSGNPDSWIGDLGGANYVWSSDIARSGNYSLCINNIASHTAARWKTTDFIPFNPDNSYEFSVWVKVPPKSASSYATINYEEKVLENLSFGQQADLYGRNATGFVKSLYDNILGRFADERGLSDWVTALNNGMSPNEVVKNLIFSNELNPTASSMNYEEYIIFLYEKVFNRSPDAGGYTNWVINMRNGMSKEDVLRNFLNSYEFQNICDIFGLKAKTEEQESSIADKVVDLAKSQIGKKSGNGVFSGMVWADTNYSYCDRFVSAVIAIVSGKSLSERKSYPTAYDDYLGQSNFKSGNLPLGVIVYFDKNPENWNYSHVGLYDGNGNIISVESPSKGVTIIPLNYFKAPILGWIYPEERK